MTVHARLSPSAGRWLYCPGAPDAEQGLPDQSVGIVTVEGTTAHAAFEVSLRLGVWSIDWMENKNLEAATNQALADLKEIVDALEPDPAFYIEYRVGPPAWRKQQDLFGTSDLVIVTPKRLIIVDLKLGRAVVQPTSVQLMIYAVLAAEKFGWRSTIETIVLQPRAATQSTMRRVSWLLPELWDFETEMERAAAATDRPDAPLIVNKHCWFCRARPTCPAYARHMQDRAVADLFA